MLVVWGSNRDNQLGIETSDTGNDETSHVIFEPTFNISMQNYVVEGVSCGSRHTLAFTNEGKVFSWGWGACGQLGHGNFENVQKPKLIEAISDFCVVLVSAGGMHSAALLSSGEAYIWGSNSFGQLGCGPSDNEKNSSNPHKVTIVSEEEENLKLKKISCGGMHSAVVTSEGEVYCWGRADSGQLGIGYQWVHRKNNNQNAMGIEYPQHCVELKGKMVSDICCGAFHTSVTTESGEVFTWGKEDHGQLGCTKMDGLSTGSLILPHLAPIKLNQTEDPPKNCFDSNDSNFKNELAQKAKKVASGGWHTAVVTEDNAAWLCGRGEYGRLGFGNEISKSSLKKFHFSKALKSLKLQPAAHIRFSLRLVGKFMPAEECSEADWAWETTPAKKTSYLPQNSKNSKNSKQKVSQSFK